MYKKNSQGWLKHLDFMIIDELSLQLGFILAAFIRLNIWAYARTSYRIYVFLLVIIDALVVIAADSMHDVMKRGYGKELSATFKHCFLVFSIMAIFMLATQKGAAYSRLILFLTFFFHLVIGYATRVAWKEHIRRAGNDKRNKRSMLAVLEVKYGEDVLKRLLEDTAGGYEITGLVLRGESDVDGLLGIPVVTTLDDASAYICREWIDDVYIDCPSTDPQIAKLIADCSQMAVPIHYHVPFMGKPGNKQFVEKMGGMTVLTNTVNTMTSGQIIVKRLADILGGIVGSILALLIMLVVGPIIKKQSPGPILYRQIRIGKNGRRFWIYKIRSMYLDADKRKKDLMEQNRVKDGMMFKIEFDPRIIGNEVLPDGTRKTGIGEFIRKTSLDEFPQFFNVLRGEMSLVGTRPPTVDEWEKYEFHHRARLAVKPGITGMWQVSGRSEITDFEEVVKLDTEYITNWSYALDIKILLKTLSVVFRGKGAM